MNGMQELDAEEHAYKIERARKRVRRARIMAALMLVLTIGTTTILYYTDMYQGLALDPRPCEPAEVEALARDDWQLASVPVEGATLAGVVKPPTRPESDWILYFGGNVDHALRTARAYAEILLEERDDLGFGSFAYRGFDTSTGEATPGKLQADARACFDYLVREHGLRAPRLHVVGFSLGANAAALLAEDLARDGAALASTTLLSPGIAPHSLPEWLFPLVIGAWEMPSKLKSMPAPVLLVSARDDLVYPAAIHARKMPGWLGGRLRQHLEIEGGHEAPLSDERALAAIRAVIRRQPPSE